MPEQPPDPLHYDMRIPPPPDPAKHREAEKPSSSESESDEDGNNEAVQRDDKEEKGKGPK